MTQTKDYFYQPQQSIEVTCDKQECFTKKNQLRKLRLKEHITLGDKKVMSDSFKYKCEHCKSEILISITTRYPRITTQNILTHKVK